MAKAPRGGKGRGKPTGRGTLPRKEPVRRPRDGGGRTYEIVCSECYSSFAMRQDSSASSINCPECLHTGNMGAKDVMSKIAIAKAAEQGNFTKALIPALLFVSTGLIWTLVLTANAVAGETVSAGVNYGFLSATLLLFIAAVALGIKYEGNRYEAYF